MDGVSANPSTGFSNASVPHVTIKSIAQNQNLDPIFEKHRPLLETARNSANAALEGVTDTDRALLLAKLRDKEEREGKRFTTDADERRWLIPKKGQHWEHWQVPFDTDPDWPKALQDAVTEYRRAWRAKMDEVNECIAANADQEELVDQPEVVKGVLRVSGPFTVEGVMPEELNLCEEGLFDGTPNEFVDEDAEEAASDAHKELSNLNAYLSRMVQLIRTDGVTFPGNKRRAFARVDALFEEASGSAIHAEGLWEHEDESEPNSVAIGFGPQYGPVTAQQVEDLIRASKRYDELVIAGFSFDAAASAAIQEGAHPKLKVHQAYIRPDINPGMDGLLKDTPNSELFTVFGQPDVEVRSAGGAEWQVELRGVEIYDPITSEVRSTGATKVAAWFLDSDYDGRCFCITQAFFPDQDAWGKIAKALGSQADPEVFESFKGTLTLPFKAGKHRRVAVKVIDPRGNEVMAIRPLDA
jgi:adenine-specific DNA-methyltransferase